MVSWSSNVDSDGIPVDHDGEQLEDSCWFDGVHGHIGGADGVYGHVHLGVPVEGEVEPDAMTISGGGHSDVSVNGEQVDKLQKKEDVEGAEVGEDMEVECSSGMKSKRGVKLPAKRKLDDNGEDEEGEQEDGGNIEASDENLGSSIQPMTEVKDEDQQGEGSEMGVKKSYTGQDSSGPAGRF